MKINCIRIAYNVFSYSLTKANLRIPTKEIGFLGVNRPLKTKGSSRFSSFKYNVEKALPVTKIQSFANPSTVTLPMLKQTARVKYIPGSKKCLKIALVIFCFFSSYFTTWRNCTRNSCLSSRPLIPKFR